jgi:hypothetical protein
MLRGLEARQAGRTKIRSGSGRRTLQGAAVDLDF